MNKNLYDIGCLYKDKGKNILYYPNKWDDTILIETWKKCNNPKYSFVFEDADLISSEDMNTLISSKKVKKLGKLHKTKYSFKQIYNEEENRYFGDNTNKVLVENRSEELKNQLNILRSQGKLMTYSKFCFLVNKYWELFK